MIDLRSDTITKPTPAMLEAMLNAELGDDVLGDDPSVKRLEEQTALLLGKEASVFVPSGTMANQIAIRCHTSPGEQIIVDENAHILFYESGAPAALSGVMCRTVTGERGVFSPEQIEAVLSPLDVHYPPNGLVCVENTHNRGGGKVWPLEKLQSITAFCQTNHLKTHMDGARLWNASIASGESMKTLAQNFDSVSVCFSKGLGAPVGSVLCGSKAFIEQARFFRKQFGGAMRQSGLLAAGALYAIEHQFERLAEDHHHAKQIADAIESNEQFEINPADIESNLVFFNTKEKEAEQVVKQLEEKQIKILALGKQTLRIVTNLSVTSQGAELVCEIIKALD